MFKTKVITYRSKLWVSLYTLYFMYVIYSKLNTDLKAVIHQAGRYKCKAVTCNCCKAVTVIVCLEGVTNCKCSESKPCTLQV
jgi:hypothetical protein